jgi:hypothetical protein
VSLRRSIALLAFALITIQSRALAGPPVSAPPDFDREVRPILAESCFACHGFDENKRMASLRLDVPNVAYGKLASGKCAIVPGDPASSEVIQRVAASGPLHMPPAYSGKKITAVQIEILRRWIASGAKYEPHWSFIPPKRPPLPAVRDSKWVRNPIDRFILARLEKERLHPSPEADRATLLRRVSLDLTGLPPSPAELAAFLADKSPNAYEKVVDRLLASPHYGERMALAWLDCARYADTHGFHIDPQRDMWPWRDWVIGAFNRNLPYDKFTVEQLAGDLLPNATTEERVASGFNRNHPINFEGGAIPEEYQTAYIVDRIDTTATTFMGLTMRCSQCHDHKYDPIRQKDYYRFYAFFNNIAENGLDGQNGNATPFIKVASEEQQKQLASYTAEIARVDNARQDRAQVTSAADERAWETMAAAQIAFSTVNNGLTADYHMHEGRGDQIHDYLGQQAVFHGKAEWVPGKLGPALKFDGDSTFVDLGTSFAPDRDTPFSYGAWVYAQSGGQMAVLSRMKDDDANRGFDLYLGDGKVYAHFIHAWDKNVIRVNTKSTVEQNAWHHLFVTYDGSSKAAGVHIYIDGKPAELDITHDTLTDTIRTPQPLLIGRRSGSARFNGMISNVRLYHRALAPDEVLQLATIETIRPALATSPERRTPSQQAALTSYYTENVDPTYRQLTTERDGWEKKRSELDAAIPTCMVMQERDKQRDTFLLIRGQYDQHGEKVTPGTPEFLPPLPAGAPANRLTLARWLVSGTHPLTARVAVNRYWQMVFGMGIVKTSEDFGIQGERPVHPELLDWLATEFVRTGWDTKAMMRLLVTSATYRQASRVSPALLERDPENRLLAHGPRFRLQAELIRDLALTTSGLLVPKIGGPSVKIYQPAGLWEELSFKGGFSAQFYVQDHGESLYRRGMYTFWKRTVPPTSLQTFDAPEREFCMVRRAITNTPLQALVLLNDPGYVEASRKFAERVLHEGGSDEVSQMRYAFILALSRPPSSAESRIMTGMLHEQQARFKSDAVSAKKLLAVGESMRDEKLDAGNLAAWTVVANMLLNLDETITKN